MSLVIKTGRDRKSSVYTKIGATGLDTEGNEIVLIGDLEIPVDQFLLLAEYVMENTDLAANDVRVDFLAKVHGYKLVPGYNQGAGRISLRRS